MSRRHFRGFCVAVLMIAALILAAACSGEAPPTPVATATPAPPPDPDPSPTPVPDPTATPEATPTAVPVPTATQAPTPEPELEDFLIGVAANIAVLSSVKFGMVDESETGALFFGTTFKSMEAVIETPNNFRMMVDVVAPGFGFVEIVIIKVGDEAVMKFSEDAPWIPLPPEQVPFNFAGLAIVFGNLPNTVETVEMKGVETLNGEETVLLEVSVPSDALKELVTSVDPGHEITLTMWVEESEMVLRQIRIAGQIYDDDAPETTRLITLDDINLPVDIELPDVASGQ